MLRNIKLKESEIKNLKDNEYDYGAESRIYKTKIGTVYKIFRDMPKDIQENKFQKVKLLSEKKIDFMVDILSTISYKGKFIGYEMPLIHNCFWQVNLNETEKIHYLKQLKQFLLTLEDNDITYADIKNDNIFIENHKLKLGDIDNISIDNYKMDLIPAVLDRIYHDGIFEADCHSLMHNRFTVDTLDKKIITNFSTISASDFNRYSKKGKRIIKKMSLVNRLPSLYNKDYLIDNLK
mgnify:CR=1 FL=1